MPQPPKINISRTEHDFKIQLEGEWRSVHMKAMEQALAQVKVPARSTLTILLSSLKMLDTVGAYLVLKFLKNLESKDISYALKRDRLQPWRHLKMLKIIKPLSRSNL